MTYFTKLNICGDRGILSALVTCWLDQSTYHSERLLPLSYRLITLIIKVISVINKARPVLFLIGVTLGKNDLLTWKISFYDSFLPLFVHSIPYYFFLIKKVNSNYFSNTIQYRYRNFFYANLWWINHLLLYDNCKYMQHVKAIKDNTRFFVIAPIYPYLQQTIMMQPAANTQHKSPARKQR